MTLLTEKAGVESLTIITCLCTSDQRRITAYCLHLILYSFKAQKQTLRHELIHHSDIFWNRTIATLLSCSTVTLGVSPLALHYTWL